MIRYQKIYNDIFVSNTMNKLISVRMADAMYDAALAYSQSHGYTSIQELMRDTLRERLVCENVFALAGSQKGKKISEEKMRELVEKEFGR
jgi:hypothetical protein